MREALAQDDHVRIAEWLAGDKRDHEALVKALRIACDKGAVENVRLLIAAGADRTAVLERPWRAGQVEVMPLMFDGMHRAWRLRALKASLYDDSLLDGAEAVVWLAEGLRPEQIEQPLIAERIVRYGCEALIERWGDPEAKLREPLPEEVIQIVGGLFSPSDLVKMRTYGELLVAFRDRTRSLCQIMDEALAEGEIPHREAQTRALLARLEACVSRWGAEYLLKKLDLRGQGQ